MLENIIRYSIKNKFAVGFFTLLLIVWGLWSLNRLPIDAVPDITNNQVQIITSAPALATQEVEQFITSPIERSLTTLPNVVELRSISRFGLSVITVVFAEDVNTYLARQLITERLRDSEEDLPEGIAPPELAPISTGLGEIYQYTLKPKAGSEGKYSLQELRTLQDWVVARALSSVPGVAEINSFGGEVKQYEVAVDPNKLRAYGIGISDIYRALERGNANTGGAYIDKKPNAYFIRGVGMLSSLEDIETISIQHSASGQPLLIRDVAIVHYGKATRYGAMTYNGEGESVGGIVMMLGGENSHKVIERLKARLAVVQQSLPEDIELEPFLDRTDLIDRALTTVMTNLTEGALIVIFVLILFLGNLRAGLIVASAIPLSMLFAIGMMNALGLSANLMSLGAIDFGLIVDGSVIVVEATLHHLLVKHKGKTLSPKAMDNEVYHATNQIRSSATFGEVIILIVYIPILTLVGVEGKMFVPMAITVSLAIIGALILSLTYIPMMCALCLSRRIDTAETLSTRLMQSLQRRYTPLLQRAIAVRTPLLIGSGLSLVLAIVLFLRLGGEFIPQLQEGDFAYQCILPQGSSLSQSIETSLRAQRIIRSHPEVRLVVGRTGSAEVPTDPMPPEATDLMVLLHPKDEWPNPSKSYQELAQEISKSLELLPGVIFEQSQPIQMRFNELMTGVRQDVAIKLFGENLDTLARYAEQVQAIAQEVQGVVKPKVEQIVGLPQIIVRYDRLRMAHYGISVEEANAVLSTAYAGKVAGQVYEDEIRFDLVVRLDSTHRQGIEDVRMLSVPNEEGQLIPMNAIATVTYEDGPAQISREDGRRRIVIGFNVSERDTQSVVEEIQERLASIALPSGYYITYGGQFENLQRAQARLSVAIPISLLLIFALLYLSFSSLRWATLILMVIPMSAIGGVLALVLRGMPFSISAGIGFIALFGVAVLNGIVLISSFNQLRQQDPARPLIDLVVEGATLRLRPVLMTALVASLGFLPMALSTGAGAEMQKPLATVVIGGLVSATLLTLFILPILYLRYATRAERKAEASQTPIVE